MTDNVPDTTNNVPETTKHSRPNGTQYWGQGDYANVTLHLDPKLIKYIKKMAIDQSVTIGVLVNEALATWVKWLAKATLDDNEYDKAKAEREFQEAADHLYRIRQTRIQKDNGVRMLVARREKLEKALLSRKAWHRIYPGKPWPGVGKQPEGFKRYAEEHEGDNVPETGKGDLIA